MCARFQPIFKYEKREEFHDKLVEWIGDVFYDMLPEHGYEVREEQIYTAFQMADAFCNKKPHLAEAGLGTGKTFAYLLPAIAYARLQRKPVIIACASTALQEQLCGEKGDINTLSNLLDLKVDARMAKDSHQYVCDARVEEANAMFDGLSDELAAEVHQWLGKTKRGERSEIPLVPDRVWNHIGWNEGMSCDMCLDRGFCKLVKAKEYYRASNDLIVVDHDLFFKDLWTREELIADGKLPILPPYSAVVFDEGHKIILPAAMQAGHKIAKEDILQMVESIEQVQGTRTSLILSATRLEEVTSSFFAKLNQHAIVDEQSERFAINGDDNLYQLAKDLQKQLDQLLLELQIDQELYMESLPLSVIRAYEMLIDRAMLAIHNFCKQNQTIAWINRDDGSFWVVPKGISTRLDKQLFQKKLPVLFTSATLSNEGDFSYLIRTLGLSNATHSTVSNCFEMDKQVEVYLPESNIKDIKLTEKLDHLVTLLKSNQGSALVLTNSPKEVRNLRQELKKYQFPFEVLWEDKAERGYVIRRFKEEVSSVLIGYDLWEGIDVPGESLTMVIVWELPFPALDPLIEEQRREAKNAGLNEVVIVDYPEMGLKLKQGCGRLIRTKEDQGKIVIMDPVIGQPYETIVLGALPDGALQFNSMHRSKNK